MKKILALTLVLLTSHLAFGQIEAKMIDFNNKLEISLEKDTFSLSFGDRIYSVNVIDARDDTGAVGYYYLPGELAFRYGVKSGNAEKNKNNDPWSKVYHWSPTLKDGLAEWVNAYLQCRKNDSAKNKLLIVVKKLWLSSDAGKIEFNSIQSEWVKKEWNAGLFCKLEFYLEKDSVFYPLYRIDSIFTFEDMLNDYAGLRFVDNAGSFISSALRRSLDKLDGIDPDNIITKRRKVSFNDIYNEYSKKTKVSVLNEVVFKKGVYANFEEFKANSPSIKEYELRKNKMGDILYVKEGNSEYPARLVWGFCDGTYIFINSGDKYSKLVRRGNTFYFFGIKGLTQSNYNFLNVSGLSAFRNGGKKSGYKMELKYYQLDMETGEPY